MSRNRIVDIALIIIFYIGVSTFPTGLITNNPYIYYGVEIALYVACLLFIILYGRRQEGLIQKFPRMNLYNFFLLLPVVVICISNFIYAWSFKEAFEPRFDYSDILAVIHIILVVIVEELIFRHILIANLEHDNKLIRIVISAGVFALCHITHFLSSFNPADLVIIVYTFGLGLVLGFMYCYGNCLYACMGLHFLFNLCNDFLFERLYYVNNTLWYFLINIFVAVAMGLYIFAIYMLQLRKNPAELD